MLIDLFHKTLMATDLRVFACTSDCERSTRTSDNYTGRYQPADENPYSYSDWYSYQCECGLICCCELHTRRDCSMAGMSHSKCMISCAAEQRINACAVVTTQVMEILRGAESTFSPARPSCPLLCLHQHPRGPS